MKTATLHLDLETLLTPITTDQPAGESLRYEGTYDRIQEARREDDPTLARGVWKTRLKKAAWDEIEAVCLAALQNRSKDLQIAVWLLEAWMHGYGFPGVQEGIKLLTGLCERFWDDLHPKWDEDNPEYRFAPLVWMNEKLALQLKQIPLTQPQTGEIPAYAWVDWEGALRLESVIQKDAKALQAAEASGKATQAKFLSSATLSPTAFYLTLAQDIGTTLVAVVEFEHTLATRCGSRAPSLSRFKETLGAIHHLVDSFLQERGVQHTESFPLHEEPEASRPTQEAMQSAGNVAAGAPIRSRAEAYRRLAEAADYLLRTEPHSPTPYLVKRAVLWGGMTLTDLLHEFIQNQNDLRAIYSLLGIKDTG